MTKHPEDDVFTGTQVGAILESLRNDISIMAERLDLRVSIPDIYSRITALESKN